MCALPCVLPCSNLFNKAELALQLVGCPPQLNEAQLLLHLYAAKGLDMLGMLQGQYAFCLYDSKQVCPLVELAHSGYSCAAGPRHLRLGAAAMCQPGPLQLDMC